MSVNIIANFSADIRIYVATSKKGLISLSYLYLKLLRLSLFLILLIIMLLLASGLKKT